jgi:hypothetical protein
MINIKPAKTTLKEDWDWLWKIGCNKIFINQIGINFDFEIANENFSIGFTHQWKKSKYTDMAIPLFEKIELGN